jgi:hypothetical protein
LYAIEVNSNIKPKLTLVKYKQKSCHLACFEPKNNKKQSNDNYILLIIILYFVYFLLKKPSNTVKIPESSTQYLCLNDIIFHFSQNYVDCKILFEFCFLIFETTMIFSKIVKT